MKTGSSTPLIEAAVAVLETTVGHCQLVDTSKKITPPTWARGPEHKAPASLVSQHKSPRLERGLLAFTLERLSARRNRTGEPSQRIGQTQDEIKVAICRPNEATGTMGRQATCTVVRDYFPQISLTKRGATRGWPGQRGDKGHWPKVPRNG